MNVNIKIEEPNDDDNIASGSGLGRCEMVKRETLMEQEIKQENELIINEEDVEWCYPCGLDVEEREYQLKYKHQDEDNEDDGNREDTFEIYFKEEVYESSDEAEDLDDNFGDDDVDAVNDDDDDDDSSDSNSIATNHVSVNEIDKCLQEKHVALQCHLCPKKFFLCYKWTKHVHIKHNEFTKTLQSKFESRTGNVYVCKQCKKRFKYKSNQLLHFLLSHATNPPEILLCKYCGYKDNKVYKLQEHLQNNHSKIVETNHKCPLCSVAFKKQALLQFHFVDEHFKEFQDKFVYNCHLCTEDTSFDGGHYMEYLEHLIAEHSLNNAVGLMFNKLSSGDSSNEIYKCEKCHKLFVDSGQHNLLEHYLTHNTTFLWTCKHCRKKYIHQEFKPLHLCPKMLLFYHELKKPHELKRYRSFFPATCSRNTRPLETKTDEANMDVECWQQFENFIQHICPFCNQTFSKFQTWQLHMREHHQIHTLQGLQMSNISNDSHKLKCMQCYIFVRKSTIDLHTHRFQHLPFKPYRCLVCSKDLPNYQTALEHMQNRCQSSSTSSSSFSKQPEDKQQKGHKNLKISKDVDQYIDVACSMCKDEQLLNVENLMEHYHVKHNDFKEYFFKSDEENATKCKLCLNTVRRFDRHNSIAHFLQHLDEKPYKCKKCQRSHSLYRRCKLHITKYHPPTTTTVSQQQLEETTSTKEKVDLSSEHQEFITFACPECNISLNSLKKWEAHVYEQHDFFEKSNIAFLDNSDGKQKCKECKIVLSTSTAQQQYHKLSHMPYKSFICLLCHHRVNTPLTLLRHLNGQHFRKGTFKCPLCPVATLTTEHERTEHIKQMHPQEEWPKTMCTLCFKVFRDLKKHMETHEVNTCDICGVGIRYFKDYKIHMEQKHNRKVDVAQDIVKTANDVTSTTTTNNKRKSVSAHGVGTKKKTVCKN